MTFTPKNWNNGSGGGTPISASALKDIEERLATYADSEAATTYLQPIAVVTAGAALAVNKLTPVNATASALTMTLPTGKAVGTILAAEKTDSTTNAVVVEGNIRGTGGAKIELTLSKETVSLIADAEGHWWPVSSHKTLGSLKTVFDPLTKLKALGEVEGETQLKYAEGSTFTAKLKGATEFVVKEAPANPTEINLLVETSTFVWSIKNITWIGSSEPTFLANKRYRITLFLVNGEVLGVNAPGPEGPRGPEGVSFRPWKDLNNLKGWTFDPFTRTAGAAATTQRIFFYKILVTPEETLSKIYVQVETKGETLTSGQNFLGVYSPTGKLLGKTADQSTIWTSTGTKEATLTAQAEGTLKLAEGVKWVFGAILCVGTTTPVFAIQSSQSEVSLVNLGLTATAGFRAAIFNTAAQTSLPTEFTIENVTSQAAVRWMGLS